MCGYGIDAFGASFCTPGYRTTLLRCRDFLSRAGPSVARFGRVVSICLLLALEHKALFRCSLQLIQLSAET